MNEFCLFYKLIFIYLLITHIVGVYSERIVGPSYIVTQRLYVHRTLRSLIVVEVDLVRSDVSEPIELSLELNRWTASYDLTFLTHDSTRQEVRWAALIASFIVSNNIY